MGLSPLAMRRRSAVALCRDYGISASEIAPLFGQDEQQFLRALERDRLSFGELGQKSRQLRLAERIMKVLQKEVEALASLGDEALNKTRLDALAQLARTIRESRRPAGAICVRASIGCWRHGCEGASHGPHQYR